MRKEKTIDLNRPIFFRWLKNHNVFGRFKHYYNDWAAKEGNLNILKEPIGNGSVGAFFWRETKEGDSFWFCLYKEWRNYYLENNLTKNKIFAD